MVDNFDMKQFLTENQIGPYARNTVKENRTAKDLFQMFKDENLENKIYNTIAINITINQLKRS